MTRLVCQTPRPDRLIFRSANEHFARLKAHMANRLRVSDQRIKALCVEHAPPFDCVIVRSTRQLSSAVSGERIHAQQMTTQDAFALIASQISHANSCVRRAAYQHAVHQLKRIDRTSVSKKRFQAPTGLGVPHSDGVVFGSGRKRVVLDQFECEDAKRVSLQASLQMTIAQGPQFDGVITRPARQTFLINQCQSVNSTAMSN